MIITFDVSSEDAIKIIQYAQSITSKSHSKLQSHPANESISQSTSKPSRPTTELPKVQSPGKPVKMPLFGRTSNQVNNYLETEQDRLHKKEDKAKATAKRTQTKKVKAEKALEELKEPKPPITNTDVSCPWKL
jgi:hypothetical protein